MTTRPDSPSGQAGDSRNPGNLTEGCPRGQLEVTVRDCDSNPVAAVTVTAPKLGTLTTDPNGVAEFGWACADTHDVKAEKPGHSDKRNDVPRFDEKKGVSVPAGGKTKLTLTQHPSCANVSFFEGSTTRSKYSGFDHRTNQVATAGTDEYWLPTPAKGSLTMPGNRQTRDGGRWLAIGVGKEAEVEINFAFDPVDCIPCLANTRFEVVPADVAEAVTTEVGAKKAVFKLKGKKKGEASLKVTCAGTDIGWLHIWCEAEATLKIDVVNVVTNRAPENAWSLAAMQAVFQEIFQQAVLKIDMIDLGKVDLTGNAAFATVESTGYPSGAGVFLDKSGSPSAYSNKAAVLAAIDTAATADLNARTAAPLPRVGAYRLYRYVPAVGCSIGGTVANIGSSPGYTFMSDGASGRNSIAHEFGHCLGLRHPSDGGSAAQFPGHLRSTLNTAVPAWAATNTEPATAADTAASNVMANDPANLMGYWSDKPNRKPLRYLQWKTASRS